MGRVKGSGEGALAPTVRATILLSPIFHCHKIKDGGCSNITNTNKVSPTQNTPALQAIAKCEYESGTKALICSQACIALVKDTHSPRKLWDSDSSPLF